MTYLPIRIGTLRPGAAVSFDIYITVGDRYVHYIKSSDPFDADRIEKLRAKGVKKLFIPESSEPAYLQYLDAGLSQLSDPSTSLEQKATVVGSAMISEAENAFHNVETEHGYRSTENRVEKVVHFLTSQAGAMRSVLAESGCALDNFQHSANVTTLAVGIAHKVGITQPRDLLDLGLAGLLHDAALAKLGFSANVKLEDLQGEEAQRYRAHPHEAALALAGKPYIGKKILELIADHEEVGDGAGYPDKKRVSTLSKSSQILNLCDTYDRYCTATGKAPLEAMQSFLTDKIGLFDLEHIKHLKTVLKG